MIEVTTSRPIDLAQLAAEVGHSLHMRDDGETRVVTCHAAGVTTGQLEAAINDHVPTPPSPPADEVREARSAVAAMVVAEKIAADTFTVADAVAVAAAFPPWAPGETVAIGDLRYHGGHLVEAIQAHTTQPDWTPDVVPALWKVWRNPDTAAPWVQPTGAHDTYALGDRVTHSGATWESTVNNNSWEPNVYGWVQV